ncbi:MAG: LemA family protein [Bacilli bacterium]|nr:LemA family protein [Bacilli bacterium]
MELVYALLIILIIACLLAIVYVFYYNKLQEAKLKVNEAESIIDENLRKKYDTIIDIKNLIDNTIKNNKINFKDLNNLKELNLSNFDLDRKLDEYMNLINTVSEDHKKINDSKEMDEFLSEIKRIDEKITSAKSFYNNYITESNLLAKKFPSNIIARIHGINVKPFFDNKNMEDEDINDFKL